MRLLATLTDLIQLAARRRHPITRFVWHLGAFGLFLLAIVDSLPIPTFAGPDILTAVLAARHGDPWYLYAAVATAGSVIGASLTYRMARKAGSDYLNRKFGERTVARLLKYFQRWGTGALIISTLVPLPFPTSAFFAAAGVLEYPPRTFAIVVALSRAGRYAAIGAIASHYGRRFALSLWRLGQHSGWWLAMAALAVLTLVAAFLLAKRLGKKKSATRNQKSKPRN